jgi:hypothetical protein
MDNEPAIIAIEARLRELGYNAASIARQFKTHSGNRIDLVIFENKKPKIAIELVAGTTLPGASDLAGLRFHPGIRQAQHLAREINAPYYAIANDRDILWFETDQSGRPRLLASPILPDLRYARSEDSSSVSKESIVRSLFSLLDIGSRKFNPDETVLYASIAVYAHVLEERGDPLLKRALIEPGNYSLIIRAFQEETHLFRNLAEDKLFFLHALSALESHRLLEAPVDSVLAAFDEFLLLRTHPYAYKLPRWLTEFFVQLADLKAGDHVLDIFSNFGDVAIAMAKAARNSDIVSIVNHPINYLWANIQQRIIQNTDSNNLILINEMPSEEILSSHSLPRPSKIIVAPPFNVKLQSLSPAKSLSEDAYLSLAIDLVAPRGRIVAILPEGFLFSRTLQRRNLRHHILNNTVVKAIFSLDAFIPNTSIRTSIIVFDKIINDEAGDVLMGRIQATDIPTENQGINSRITIPQAERLKAAFRSHDKADIKAAGAWMVPASDLTADNFEINRYAPSKLPQLLSTYPTAQLAEISEIFKGSPLTLDKYGDLLVIGPAAVRKFALDATKLDRTQRANLPAHPVTAQPNDIVINALSNYRGQAALVTPHFAKYFISRNIIVVRLKSGWILPSYLEIALNSTFVTRQLLEKTTGSVIRQVTKGALLDILIPVPDLQMQQLIVDRTTKALQDVHAAHELLREQTHVLNEAKSSLDDLLEHLHVAGGVQ